MPPLPEVADARRQTFGVQGDAQRVRRARAGAARRPRAAPRRPRWPCTICQPRSTTTHGNGLYALEHPLDALPDGGHVGVVEGALAVHRRETRGHQQLVLFAQRHVEHLGESQHHRATRGRPTGLDEAHVTRRHVGLDREVELAQPAALSPLAHQRPERQVLHVGRWSRAQCCARRGRRPLPRR